jgi:hypothetical protein
MKIKSIGIYAPATLAQGVAYEITVAHGGRENTGWVSRAARGWVSEDESWGRAPTDAERAHAMAAVAELRLTGEAPCRTYEIF